MKPSDFLTELSTDKLAKYKTAAAADASKADKEKDYARGDKRFSGIVKATKKQFANDTKQGVAEGSTETTQQQQVRAAITKGMEKWNQNGLATYQSQPAKRHYFASSDWASGQLKGINSIDPDGTVVIELNDTTTAGLVKKLASLGGMPGVKTRQLKMTFDPAKMKNGVTPGEVAEEKCPHCGGEMVSEELINEKKDACYYKVKSRYKVWPSAYASGALVKCRNKGASNWGNSSKNESSILEGIEQADESLHDWFNKEKWVRMDTKGNIKGPCAKEPGEGKPKCLPQSKAHSLGKKGRASAAARKRREDPNPERHGKAINVNTKKKSNEGVAEARSTHDPFDDMVEDYLDWLEKHNMFLSNNTREEEKASIIADLESGVTHPDELEYAMSSGQGVAEEQLDEKWSTKYKDSINCSNPKGFSQKAHCQGKNK